MQSNWNRQTSIQLSLLRRERIRRASLASLAFFTRVFWPVIEPSTVYVHGWHIDAICDHLEACARFEIRRLLMNLPPRHMKSILVNVMFPAWVWAHEEWASRRFLCGSYARELSIRDGIKMRSIIKSPLYQMLFQPSWKMRDDQDQKLRFDNTFSGFRMATSVEGGVTGEGGDFLTVDDPLNAMDSNSEAARGSAIFWLDKVFSTRVNDPKRNARIMVMQRLHEADPSGHVLNNATTHGKYEHLILQARYESKPRVKSQTSLGFVDPRTKDGELLWPQRFDEQALRELEIDLKDDAHAQLQQDPKPKSGALFKREWWMKYDKSPSTVLEIVQFWDCAQKPGITNDFSACATWARAAGGYFLLDLWRGKVEAPFLEAMVLVQYNKWNPTAVVIEDKSAGQSLIQYLNRLVEPVVPVIAFDPRGDKEVRATAATPTVQSGKCHLPSKPIILQDEIGNDYDVVEAFKAEHERFPKAAHDDMVDTTSMMVNYFAKRGSINPRIRSL